METQNKPTLVTAKRKAHEGTRRILASLEHGALTLEQERVARWKLNGWTMGLCILLLAMTVLAWVVHQSAVKTVAHQDDAPPSVGAARSDTIFTHATAAPTTLPAASQAAAIINDGPVQVEIVRRADPQGAALSQQSGKPAGSEAGVAGTLAGRPAKTVAKTAGIGPAHARKATAALPVAPSDTDVTLLAALVAHANHPAVVTAERSRDIVERADGDNTAELLRRCKQLGLIEGMLCRSRICSGRWENDPACRTPSR